MQRKIYEKPQVIEYGCVSSVIQIHPIGSFLI